MSAVRPGYKQTEVGLIPLEWQAKRLGDLGKPVRGASPRPAGDPRYFNGSYKPWLTVAALTNLNDSQIWVCRTETFLTENGARYSRELPAGSVIIANSGATLGVAKLLGINCCANDGVAALLDLSNEADPVFLVYFINSITRLLRETVATGNGQPNLNTDRIGRIKIPLPPMPEQQAISEALGDADALIASLEALIAKKRDIKRGAMQELLTGHRRLPGFLGEWHECQLGALGTFAKGSGIKKDEAKTGSMPCVRYGELYTHHTDIIRQFNSHISSKVAKGALRLRKGDILFAGSGETKEEIGKCVAFVDGVEAYAGGDIIVLHPSNSCAEFLGYYLNTPHVQRQKASRGQGDAVVHISSRALASIELKLPSTIEEQIAIAAVLMDMDAEIAALNANLAKVRAVKQGMMQVLLTGEIRLI